MGAQGPDFWAIFALIVIVGIFVWRWRQQNTATRQPGSAPVPADDARATMRTSPITPPPPVPPTSEQIARLAVGGLAPLAIAEHLGITRGEVELALRCAEKQSGARNA